MYFEKYSIKSFRLEECQNWLKQLHEVGCVVISQVLNAGEMNHSVDLFWEWLESLHSGLDRADPETWQNASWPGNSSLGFCVSYGGCHSKASWFLRCHPNVRAAFATIWNTNQLITSFDTFICWRPWWRKIGGTWDPEVENLHVDQNPSAKRGLCAVQGMIPLRRVSKHGVGGLMVVPFTNNDQTQDALISRYPSVKHNRSDWVELSNKDPLIGKGVLVECQPGDLILWDSRTVHGGKILQPSEEFKLENKCNLARLAMTVTMVPRSWASSEVLEKRKEAFAKKVGLTHWPHEFNKSGMGCYAQNIDRQKVKYDWPELAGDIIDLV